MTVPVKQARKVIDASGGWSNPLTHDFQIENVTDVAVYADGVQLVQGVDYTVTLTGPGGVYDSYAVYVINPEAWSPQTWVLKASYPVNQPSDVDHGGVFAKRFEDALDRMARMVQSVKDDVDRSIKMPLDVGVPPAPTQKGQFWKSDENGFAVPGGNADDVVEVQTFAERAREAAETAEAAAAGVNLPAVEEGDAGKVLVVDDSEDGYRLAPDPLNSDNSQYLGRGGASFAVLRSVQSALRDQKPSVTDYGVGAHGFNGAMDRAVNAAPTSGQTILIPAGDWVVEGSTIVVAKNGIVLEGAGHGGTRILNGLTTAAAIQLGANSGGSGAVWRVGAKDLVFGSASGVVAAGGQVGLLVRNASDVRLQNIETYQYPAPLHVGIRLETVYLALIDRVITSGATAVGQQYRNVVSLCFLSAESLANGTHGYTFEGVEGIWGQNVHAYGNAGYGIQFASHASRRNKNNFLTNWIGDTSGDSNWFVTDLSNSTLVNCWAATNLDTAVNPTAAGFLLATDDVFGLQFIGGRCGNNNGDGVSIWGPGGSDYPRDIQFHGFDFGPDETELPSNGRGGIGTGLSAVHECTGVRVFGGKNKGNPSAFFSPNGIDLIRDVDGYINSRRMSVTGTTNASGDLTFSHGMQETPATVICAFEGTTARSAQATAKTSSQVTVRVHDAAGAAVTNTSVTFTAIMAGARA